MCFAPQLRALLRHLDFKKYSEVGVLCAFWLRYVLRATAASTFSTSQLPKALWYWGALYILTWKRTSRFNAVHFFDISISKSGPNMVRFVPQLRALFRHLNFQKWSEHGVPFAFWLPNVLRATAASTFSTSQLPKALWYWGALYILTWKRTSRFNAVHFFDISISKSGPNMVRFVPQLRALFRHLNFQKRSDTEVLCTFWLGNALRASMPCTFSTSQFPKVVRTWCAFCILTSKCASRRSCMQLFISYLVRWLRTRRFSEPAVQPSGATNHWKNTVFRAFLPFPAPASSFFWLSSLIFSLLLFSSLLFSSLLFSSLTFPTSAFPSLHIVGSLTSKLPSVTGSCLTWGSVWFEVGIAYTDFYIYIYTHMPFLQICMFFSIYIYIYTYR